MAENTVMREFRYKDINEIKNHYLKKLSIEIAYLQKKRDDWLRLFNLNIAAGWKKRERLRLNKLRELQHKGISVANNAKTLFAGYLSLACISCMRGETYNYVPTFNCNKECFFCYQPHFQYNKIGMQKSLHYSPIINIKELLKKKELKSFSISGGEPLLVMDKVINSIRLVRKHFGSNCRIHLYSNGTLIKHDILRRLRDAGLDEIRFNLAANNYHLAPVYLAKDYIPAIIVEVPVIPEDENKIKYLMAVLDKLGIFGLNLHELLFFGYNHSFYKKRGYMLKTAETRPFYSELAVPIYHSEETAFHLLEFAIKKQYTMSVHYCSCSAKQDIQHIRKRYQYAVDSQRPYEKITEDGLLEKLVIYEPENRDALKDLKCYSIPQGQINISSDKRRLEIHPDNLRYLNLKKYEVGIVRSLPDYRDVDIKVIN